MGGIADQVIRRQHQQQRVVAVGGGLQRRQRDGRGGVAPHRLQQNRIRFNSDLAHLLSHDEAVAFVADQQWCRQGIQTGEPLVGLLQQRCITVTT